MSDIKGKTVIITGASKGIGATTAKHLAAQGARVILAARSAGALRCVARDITDSGGTAHAIACDVRHAQAVEQLVHQTVDLTGRIDALVNNAGVIDPIARIVDSDSAAWSAVVDVNLKGVYHGLRFVVPQMIRQGGGTVINISSGAATSALEGWSHYCATKAGVLALTRVADKELRTMGVRVIGLSPGTVATDMQVQIKASGINPVSQLDANAHISPEWVARAIEWLMGPNGDAYRGIDFSLKTDEGRAAVGLAVS